MGVHWEGTCFTWMLSKRSVAVIVTGFGMQLFMVQQATPCNLASATQTGYASVSFIPSGKV